MERFALTSDLNLASPPPNNAVSSLQRLHIELWRTVYPIVDPAKILILPLTRLVSFRPPHQKMLVEDPVYCTAGTHIRYIAKDDG